MPRQPEKPEGCQELKTYAGFRWCAHGWIRQTLGNIIIVGPTSQGKTETIRGEAAAGAAPLVLQGINSPTSAFMKIQEWVVRQGNDGPIIIDDADPLFATLAGQTMMKELILDKPNRTVTHGTEYAGLRAAGLGKEFQMSNPVAIILNRWRTFNDHLAAVKARGKLVYVNFSAPEVHQYVGTWFLDRPSATARAQADEVYALVGQFLPLIPTPNIREYYEEPLKELLTEERLGRPNPEGDWKRMLLRRLVRPNEMEAAVLYSDPYSSNAEKARAFVGAGHGSARTFYRHLAKFRAGTTTADDMKAADALADALESEPQTTGGSLPSGADVLDAFLDGQPG